jgi:putative membrane protein
MNVRASSVSIIAAAALAVFVPAAVAQNAVKPTDKTFLTKAAMGGEAEVTLATMAQQKAADPKVKALAERIETDHKKANADLRAIIVAKGLTVPGGPDAGHAAVKARLEKLDGAKFDQAYAAAMVEDHVKDIREFEMAAKSTDAAVKDFAQKTLPTLREHLKMAQDAKATAGNASPVARGTSAPSGAR